jgi:hypothetical protein
MMSEIAVTVDGKIRRVVIIIVFTDFENVCQTLLIP